MEFRGFHKEGIVFLTQLRDNNTKEWFEANRHIYTEHIEQVNKSFVEEMGEHLQLLVPTIHYAPKVAASLFRIYRDTRFSKDKTPMKSTIGIIFWQGAGHRMQSSSFYMHYNTQGYFIATGIRNFKPPLLAAYREYIQDSSKREELKEIFDTLKAKGYSICEPKYKRLPRAFDKSMSSSELAKYGAIYAYKEYSLDEVFFSEAIIDRAFKIYSDMLPLQQWLYELTLFAA